MRRLQKKMTALSFVLLMAPLFAQQEPGRTQTLIPREVFIGDDAQILYTFTAPADFFAWTHERPSKDGPLPLDISLPQFKSAEPNCTVHSAALERSGNTCTLRINITAWKNGTVEFEPFDLYEAVPWQDENPHAPLIIALEPVEIASITQKLGAFSLRPPMPPISLPGTNYILWSLMVLLTLVLLMTGLCALKFRKIMARIHGMTVRLGFYRNARAARKKLIRLSRAGTGDQDFCGEWQGIMRAYIKSRLGMDICGIPSSFIFREINGRTAGLMSGKMQDAAQELGSLFIRTDYIRYAQGSLDSQLLPREEHAAALNVSEREKIIKSTLGIIAVMERQEADND